MAKKPHFYKIGDACKLVDIAPYVLRYWETEFSALRPSKSKSGQRVYSEDEIGIIRRIKVLLYDEGYTIAGAKKKLDAELGSGLIGNLFEAAEGAADEDPDEAADLPGDDTAGATASPAAAELVSVSDAEAAMAEPVAPAEVVVMRRGRGGPRSAAAVPAAPVAEVAAPQVVAATEVSAVEPPANVERTVAEVAADALNPVASEASARSAQLTAEVALDTSVDERIETLRRGIAEALVEARALRSMLDLELSPK